MCGQGGRTSSCVQVISKTSSSPLHCGAQGLAAINFFLTNYRQIPDPLDPSFILLWVMGKQLIHPEEQRELGEKVVCAGGCGVAVCLVAQSCPTLL